MATYNFNVKLEQGNWEIQIATAANYGYFENTRTGGGGGLWFDGMRLVDYDGVCELPGDVKNMLSNRGYSMEGEF